LQQLFWDIPKQELAFGNMICSRKCILMPQKPQIQSHYRNRGGPRSEGIEVDNIPQILLLPSISGRQENIQSQNHVPES
jgi:hypothetical protein